MANDVDFVVKERKAAGDGFGRHTVRAREDFLAGLALQLALHP
jgi:hypothetical protein